MSEYVVNKERLRDYLYSLGFNYRTVPDRTKRQENVWLFEINDMLKDAITYYTDMKNKMMSQNK